MNPNYGREQHDNYSAGEYSSGGGYGYSSGYVGGSLGGQPATTRPEWDTWQSSQQSQRGKGPKGYRRSDERIKDEVCERLADDWMVNPSDVSVEVRDGVVTLEGSAQSRQMKHRIEDIADSVSGVEDIQNRIGISGQT